MGWRWSSSTLTTHVWTGRNGADGLPTTTEREAGREITALTLEKTKPIRPAAERVCYLPRVMCVNRLCCGVLDARGAVGWGGMGWWIGRLSFKLYCGLWEPKQVKERERERDDANNLRDGKHYIESLDVLYFRQTKTKKQ